ncbi:MAG: FAD-dependent oxidoreductase [Draconibacterium sp.]|nr:FAD-dependent oxidoreductase [Draconibacterium sp.]
MKRRNFIGTLTAGGTAVLSAPFSGLENNFETFIKNQEQDFDQSLHADAIVIGGGLGGFAATLALLRNNKTVILTEETDWIGGQLTQQGVPPDEHPWIENTGSTQSYRDFRNAIRDYYRQYYPLTEEASKNPFLNPGDGAVSRLCHEPKVALAILNNLLSPYISSGKLILLLNHKVSSAEINGDFIKSLTVKDLQNKKTRKLSATYFVDASELGDLLPLTGAEFVTGTESKSETGEIHAPEIAGPNNVQAFTACFAMDYVPGETHTIQKPADYDFWKNHVPDLNPPWPGKLLSLEYTHPSTLKPKLLGFNPTGASTGETLNLWNYRKIINKNNFKTGTYSGDITIVNWPQNDYMPGNLIGSEQDFSKHFKASKQLSLSLLYWLQTEAPRPDGGNGWPELRLRNDIMGTDDGLAKYPYVRESRRIKAMFTILEEHVGQENYDKVSGKTNKIAAPFYDSVGIGYYHIDLHPTCGGVNYVDFPSLRFQIPLGALLPVRLKNLLPANKNIGTTHITNGCYRLHPVEWSIGESVGSVIQFALQNKVTPHEIRAKTDLLKEFQDFIRSQGIETEWPEEDKLK